MESPQCSLLIVDDDRALVRAYQRILEDAGGYQVATSLSRREALDWLATHDSPDVLLLDCRMAGMSNADFKKTVDELTRGKSTPRLIGFSSFPEGSEFAAEMRSIFGEFFEKPNDIEKFLDLIQKLCQ